MPTPLQLRSGVAALATLAAHDLAGLWSMVSTPQQARDALAEVLPALIDKYGAAAASLAADWYDDLRESQGIGGRFQAIPAEIGDMGTDALAGWAVGPLFQQESDWSMAAIYAEGGLQRRIANLARDTITRSSVADDHAVGWKRAGRGECSFCRLLIGRGAVYTEASADFKSHDRCHCVAVPEFAQ